MSTINDGGQAFPLPVQNNVGGISHYEPGMSLRDWFAGQALAGVLGEILLNQDNYLIPAQARGVSVAEDTAMMCYQQADAMLAEREKTP